MSEMTKIKFTDFLTKNVSKKSAKKLNKLQKTLIKK